MIFPVGTRVVRLDDGMKGTVEMTTLPGLEKYYEARIVYNDRGERRVASKNERWEAETQPRGNLRQEEAMLVAMAADRQLEAIERHMPDRHWEPLGARYSVYDPKLVEIIVGYCLERG